MNNELGTQEIRKEPGSSEEAATIWSNRETPFSEAAAMLWAIQRRMIRGCGNHGCKVGKIEGMATNGPCRCTAKDFARELQGIANWLIAES